MKKIYIYAFLIKKHLYILGQAQNSKTFSNCLAAYQKELCLPFEKSGNFFHRANVQIGMTPLPLFIFVRFLRIPSSFGLFVKIKFNFLIQISGNESHTKMNIYLNGDS